MGLTATPHTFAVGEFVTPATMNGIRDALNELLLGASGKVTAPIATITTATVLATAPAVTGDGVKRFKITGSFYGLTGTVAGDIFEVKLIVAATLAVLGQWRITIPASPFQSDGKTITVSDVPAVGSLSYQMTMTRAVGTGSATVLAGATDPIEVIVERIA
jgi:uncharacterized membrane protein